MHTNWKPLASFVGHASILLPWSHLLAVLPFALVNTHLHSLTNWWMQRHDEIFQCTKNAINTNSTAQQIKRDNLSCARCTMHCKKRHLYFCTKQTPNAFHESNKIPSKEIKKKKTLPQTMQTGISFYFGK